METIRTVIKWFLLVGGMIFWFFVTVGLATSVTEKVYDCALAEISPDYPREVVNECRRIRSGKSIST